MSREQNSNRIVVFNLTKPAPPLTNLRQCSRSFNWIILKLLHSSFRFEIFLFIIKDSKFNSKSKLYVSTRLKRETELHKQKYNVVAGFVPRTFTLVVPRTLTSVKWYIFSLSYCQCAVRSVTLLGTKVNVFLKISQYLYYNDL